MTLNFFLHCKPSTPTTPNSNLLIAAFPDSPLSSSQPTYNTPISVWRYPHFGVGAILPIARYTDSANIAFYTSGNPWLSVPCDANPERFAPSDIVTMMNEVYGEMRAEGLSQPKDFLEGLKKRLELWKYDARKEDNGGAPPPPPPPPRQQTLGQGGV